MLSGRILKKIFITLLIVSALVLFAACYTGVPLDADAAGNNDSGAAAEIGDKVITIDSSLPLAAQTSAATASAVFNGGGNVDTTSLQNGSVTLNTNLADKGIVGICADMEGGKKLKAKVALDDQAVYYDISPGEMIKVPMQFGNGTYRVELYQNISGSEYAGLYGEDVDISMSDANTPFLYSSEIVDYEDSAVSYPLTAALMQGKGSDGEILAACYDYVTKNITYDYDKINHIDSSYIPDIDEVLNSKKGICYDYAAVMASLLREAGIPAKLMMGYRTDAQEYHAWNQALVDGEWVTVDATWGAVMLQSGQSDEVVKDASLYSADKYF